MRVVVDFIADLGAAHHVGEGMRVEVSGAQEALGHRRLERDRQRARHRHQQLQHQRGATHTAIGNSQKTAKQLARSPENKSRTVIWSVDCGTLANESFNSGLV